MNILDKGKNSYIGIYNIVVRYPTLKVLITLLFHFVKECEGLYLQNELL